MEGGEEPVSDGAATEVAVGVGTGGSISVRRAEVEMSRISFEARSL